MTAAVVEWEALARAAPGEQACGDRALVSVDGERALTMAVDGLGHGPDAAAAAERALAVAGAQPADGDLAELVRLCHRALADTRGAAMSVARLDGGSGTLTWLGVGNVEGRLLRAATAGDRPESLLCMPGIVGHRLGALASADLPLGRGDVVILATDGVAAGFADDLRPSGTCRAIAERVLDRHGRPGDDALVVVVRYLGRGR